MPMGTLVIDQTLPPVSVVLPTLNERGYVTDCLTSLLAQDYPSIDEILVVDGGSDDGTRRSPSPSAGRSGWWTTLG